MRQESAGAVLAMFSAVFVFASAAGVTGSSAEQRLAQASTAQPPSQAVRKPPARGQAPAHAQPVAQTTPQPAAGLQSGATPPAQPPSVFEDHVRQSKIVTCAKMFTALGRGMSDNFSYAAQSQWDSKAGNAHAIQSLVALKPAPNAPSQQLDAGIVFAAPIGSGCEGHLVRVTPVTTSCQDVAAQLARSEGKNTPLGDLSVSAMPNGAQVMLIPFEKSCVTMTVLRAAE
ncbi:MAG: hypothetical protein FWD68_18365 [Alphaproteobacteria bacterium]|nr:hypothetical protein [Alphaproteobacteria bacterium]